MIDVNSPDKILIKAIDDMLNTPTFAARFLLKNAPKVKITWKDRVKWKVNDYLDRIKTAWDVLKGTHYCDD